MSKEKADIEWEMLRDAVHAAFWRFQQLGANSTSKRNRERFKAIQSKILEGFEDALDIED